MKYTNPILAILVILLCCHCDDESTPPTPTEKPIGVNLSSFRDWSSEFVFKDAFKMCREWTQINRANGAQVSGFNVPLREDGYPQYLPFESGGTQFAVRTFILTGQTHPLPEGDYTLIAEGTGQIRIRQSGGVETRILNTPGSLAFPKENNSFFIIDLLESEAEDPVHNVRLVMPGFMGSYETEPFHPEFLSVLENFQCIRFMDWMRTNGSTIMNWEQRTPEEYYSQTLPFAGNVPYRGVAYEYMASLSNLLDKDIWVNIPHMASDDYIEAFAEFLRDEVDEDQKVYVEYSNELWNQRDNFPQSQWAAEQGAAMGYPGNILNQRSLFTAKRSADIFRIFENVFGDDSERLVKVLAGQAGNVNVAETIVTAFLENVENVNPDGVEVDVLAIAPYFGNFISEASDVDDALNEAQTSMETMAFERINNHLNLIADSGWDIPLIAYEGGQHLESNDTALNEIFCTANRHERMGDLYCQYFNYWYDNEGGLFMCYNSVSSCRPSGSWGLKEYTGQPDEDAPKFRAVLNCVVADE